uniref:Uncharacterized protein n=1 Tax=Salvator merianae TaxID=96440 RepID=A0A8D0C740_SALMN
MLGHWWFLVLFVPIAFLTTVESPALHCGPEEYYSDRQQFCCEKCPAGKYVFDECSWPRKPSICKSCNEGKDFTAHANDFEACLPCSECKLGEIIVRSCNRTSDTECRCKNGYFRPPAYEECVKCMTKCPDGQIIVQRCNSITDAKCGLPPTAVKCPTPQMITNGRFSANGSDIFTSGMFVEYSCESGYKLIGEAKIFCTESGSWNSSEPNCKKATGQEAVIDIGVGSGIIIIIILILAGLYYVRRHFNGKTSCYKRDEDAKESLITVGDNRPGQQGAASQIQNTEESNLESNNTNPESPASLPQTREDSAAASDIQLNLQVQQSKKRHRVKKNNNCEELEEIYFEVRKNVRPRNWNMLMRKSGLSDNEIERIKLDHSNNTDEQCYYMLKMLRDKLGIEEASSNLLDGLCKEELNGIYENLINELRSKGITIEIKD